MLGSSFSHMSLFWVCSLYPPPGAVCYSARQVELGGLKFERTGVWGGLYSVRLFLKML